MQSRKTTTRTHGRPLRRRRGIQLLQSRFRYPHEGLFLGKARFFGDAIELGGWRLRRRQRSIPLVDIAHLEYHTLENDANLTLYLVTDEVIRLHMREAHRWRAVYESWLQYQVLPSAKLIRELDAVTALAG